MSTFLKPTVAIQWFQKHVHNGITVGRVCNYLAYVMGSSCESVKFGDKELEIWELASHPELVDLPASILKIKFIGGPPGRYEIYTGTLWNYVIDRALWEGVHKDWSHVSHLNRLCNEVRETETADAS